MRHHRRRAERTAVDRKLRRLTDETDELRARLADVGVLDMTPTRDIEPHVNGFRLTDRLARQSGPERMRALPFLTAVPGLAGRFDRQIPAQFTSEDVDGDGWPVTLVSCPCGEVPAVRKLSIGGCGCGRKFLHIGPHVMCATPADLLAA